MPIRRSSRLSNLLGAAPAATGELLSGTIGKARVLADSKWSYITGTYARIVQIVAIGVWQDRVEMSGAPNGMRACVGSILPDDQVHEVAAYAYTPSHH